MNILCIGDVVGANGCEALRRALPELKRQYDAGLTVVNGENSFEHNGIVRQSAAHIFASGADVITTGNHVYRRPEFYQELERNPDILRPANYPDTAPGSGFCLVDLGRVQAAVLNLMGVIYMEPLRNPFDTADDLVRQAVDAGARIILLDFHAEATSEKRAMGYYLDGRITAMFGTHTHVQTADACVLPKGTGYITDVGMTGPQQSVLGVQPEIAIAKMKDLLPVRFENAGGRAVVCGCVFDVDEKSGLTRQAQPICQLVEVEDQKGDHK